MMWNLIMDHQFCLYKICLDFDAHWEIYTEHFYLIFFFLNLAFQLFPVLNNILGFLYEPIAVFQIV